jgi:ParB/RepB/Spo0J family partition protein
MDPALYETLSAEIDRGFVQPVLVSPTDDGRYRMIDGEHRWRLVAEKGYETVPAVIERYEDSQEGRDQARIRLLTMNRLRGQFVPIRLAYVLADLAQRIPEDELRKRLGMEAGELTDHLRLAAFSDDLGDRLREGIDREQRNAPTVLTFVVGSQKDASAIERVIAGEVGDKIDRGQALARVCRSYERAKKEKR